MHRFFQYDEKRPSDLIYRSLVVFACILIGFGFCCDTPIDIVMGVYEIIQKQAGLITDSMMVGGVGAAFVNAGLVTLLSILLIRLCKINFSGVSIACLFLMAGFALFGKDVCNILPILFGGFLYARYKKERFGRYLYISLFGTALAPLVTEVATFAQNNPVIRIMVPMLIGMFIGFILPPVAAYTVRIHQGYNLYNVGFAAGLIGMIIASLFKAFGCEFEARLVWSEGNNLRFSIFLFLLFAFMIGMGFCYNHFRFTGFWRITRHSGRSVADFVVHDGFPVVLMNMGTIGAAATLYVLAIGAPLNGPTIGGIFTICGFGAFGKHLKNITPVMLGVVMLLVAMLRPLDSPQMLLATLFSTGLAPIAGQYGWKWGMVAGIIHAAVVVNVGVLNGGLNLYNNGFAAGMICIVLIPLIEALHKENATEDY